MQHKFCMKIDCIKLNCNECCSRYWITLLPAEARKIAKYLSLTEKEFIENNCVLLAQLYTRSEKADNLTVSRQQLPQKVAKAVEEELGFLPPYFLALPSLALKRAKGECVFLSKGRCRIYSTAPAICKLFPFIAISSRPLKQLYPFCAALQKQPNLADAKGELDKKQKRRVNKYFDYVEENGFSSCWKHLPAKGIVLLEGEKELQVSKKEVMQLLESLL